MMEIPRLIIIGGSMRNVGKTTLATQLIKKYAAHYPVTGLKVTTIYPGDESLHGTHEQDLRGEFEIMEEKNLSGRKDTSKMLLAGAKQVFYIRAKDAHIRPAFDELQTLIPENALIVCESISLRRFVIPGLFLLIRHAKPHHIKASAKQMEKLADRVLISDGEQFDFDTGRIVFKNGEWYISDEVDQNRL